MSYSFEEKISRITWSVLLVSTETIGEKSDLLWRISALLLLVSLVLPERTEGKIVWH